MKRVQTLLCLTMTVTLLSSSSWAENKHYPHNIGPMMQEEFVLLPLGTVKPQGWLKDQLTVQANGLTGHLDEFWPDLLNSAWRGKNGDAWERGPYYLDGLVPLAYLLDDARLIEKVNGWMDAILASGKPDGWFGPEKNKDRWPLSVAMKDLIQFHEATGDPRVIPLLQGYVKYLLEHRPDWPTGEWRGVRAMENAVSLYWLYRRTGDPKILNAAEVIFLTSQDWTTYFNKFPWTSDVFQKNRLPYDWGTVGMTAHVVNIAMAIKYPGLWYQQSGDERFKEAVYTGIAELDKNHGQVTGRFSGDEHLSGRRPTQGTELCGVVEYMYSLENLVSIFGDPVLADRLESLAYNAKPGACTADYWAHQYDQQANQVLCSVAKRDWSTNSDTSNLYGLEPNFGCCTANMHQGWPKFVASLWMATHDNGLAAVAYGPCTVKAKVADGAEVTVSEETNYPFDDTIRFRVSLTQPSEFPLTFRIPEWADDAALAVDGTTTSSTPGSFVTVKRQWKDGDTVELRLPMKIRVEPRYNNTVSILRGPLVYSLKVEAEYKKLKQYHDTLPVIDWEVRPTSAWNYALDIDKQNPEKSLQVVQSDISSTPYDPAHPPVVLKAKGRKLTDWTLVNNSAGDPPVSPVVSSEPLEELTLVPYGSTQLRVSEIPYLEKQK